MALLSETKSLVESEQSYMLGLLTLHKLYGDPRGRVGQQRRPGCNHVPDPVAFTRAVAVLLAFLRTGIPPGSQRAGRTPLAAGHPGPGGAGSGRRSSAPMGRSDRTGRSQVTIGRAVLS